MMHVDNTIPALHPDKCSFGPANPEGNADLECIADLCGDAMINARIIHKSSDLRMQ